MRNWFVIATAVVTLVTACSTSGISAGSEEVPFVSGQRALGPVVVKELAIEGAILSFRADSGGCTNAGSFTVDVVKEEPGLGAAPHYRLTIRRVVADDCKAFLPDGVLIEIDMETDLGLAAPFTVLVTNPVIGGSGAEQ